MGCIGILQCQCVALTTTGCRATKLQAQEIVMDLSLVSRNPEIMGAAACFTGTRVPVKNLFEHPDGASALEEFLQDFPSVQRAGLRR